MSGDRMNAFLGASAQVLLKRAAAVVPVVGAGVLRSVSSGLLELIFADRLGIGASRAPQAQFPAAFQPSAGRAACVTAAELALNPHGNASP